MRRAAPLRRTRKRRLAAFGHKKRSAFMPRTGGVLGFAGVVLDGAGFARLAPRAGGIWRVADGGVGEAAPRHRLPLIDNKVSRTEIAYHEPTMHGYISRQRYELVPLAICASTCSNLVCGCSAAAGCAELDVDFLP